MAEIQMLRTSERKAFKECPTKWWWRYVEGLVPRHGKSGALWFGTVIHAALEAWYIPGTKRGVEPQETFEKLVDGHVEHIKTLIVSGERADGEQEQFVDFKDLGLAILGNYRQEYGLDDRWQVISPEQTAQIMIPDPDKTTARKWIVKYVATFDLVAIDLETGFIWLWDHKTAKAIQLGHLPMDDQAGSYWAIAHSVLVHQGLMKPNQQIKGILYNFLMKSAPDERPRNADGLATNIPKKEHYVAALKEGLSVDTITTRELNALKLDELKQIAAKHNITVLGDVAKTQPAERFKRHPVNRTRKERKTQIERIGAEATVMEGVRKGTIPLYKSPSDKCSFCEFYDMCRLDEERGDISEYKKLIYKYEDPYAAHRLKEKS